MPTVVSNVKYRVSVITNIICTFRNNVIIYLTILIDLKPPTNKMFCRG